MGHRTSASTDAESCVPPAFRLRRTRPPNGVLPRALRTSPCVRGRIRRLWHFAISQRAGLEPKTSPSSVRGIRTAGAPARFAHAPAFARDLDEFEFSLNGARRRCSSLSGIARRARTAAWVYA
ncbi:uncharacterized protein TRAVEDRAFT_31781 [Trametes versicolor FP-101664 SS1]|uniref:uncharacterized protein n=1 Tax=Trametes versicolor (strain FP-101664) TaxID=717944 RepID=UPI0004623C56|nr:uncharacterized protein TRAVEDRAFT_31781 [Trametes versicolor FP-101664 SS1]EIW52581.1 hypothetical protein TRAVEDRAFT_31781 [Trametes versicolor FP-101664 SS1]